MQRAKKEDLKRTKPERAVEQSFVQVSNPVIISTTNGSSSIAIERRSPKPVVKGSNPFSRATITDEPGSEA